MINGSPFHMTNSNVIKLIRLTTIFFILVVMLAGLSYITTIGEWVGDFPRGEYHLIIQNQSGAPINGAILNVFKVGSHIPAYNWPLDNYSSEHDLISDQQGLISVLHKPGGRDIGGTVWRLFWVFPFFSGTPQYDCEVTANGYKPLKFSIMEIFRVAFIDNENIPTKTIQVNGYPVDIKVFIKTFVLLK